MTYNITITLESKTKTPPLENALNLFIYPSGSINPAFQYMTEILDAKTDLPATTTFKSALELAGNYLSSSGMSMVERLFGAKTNHGENPLDVFYATTEIINAYKLHPHRKPIKS